MIHIDFPQGSGSWLEAKAGIPSASNFHRILTPKTLKLSSAAEGYANELLAEQILGRPLDDATTEFMQRGTELEAAARKWYALQCDVDVRQVGFILHDSRRFGCSPDGLIGEEGGLEIKCPEASAHVGYLLGDVPDKYMCQMQGALWITGRKYWDFVSFNPELPSVLIRFARDEKFIAALASAVDGFVKDLDAKRAILVSRGCEFKLDRAPVAGAKAA